MTVFAQRHPASVRSIVLSSAFPLRFDMWARANERAVRLAIRRVCARSTTGRCDGQGSLRQLAKLARRLHAHPIGYQLGGESRVLDETALAGIAYGADTNIGQLPAIVRAALRGDTGPLIAAAQQLAPTSGSQARGGPPDLALATSVLCNDYPTLWDRSAPIPVRLRQFEARRARLDQSPFWPFRERAWTSAVVDRGNSCIRWPDRHRPVQRTSGPFADVPVLVTSGDLDANAPTAEGRLAARQFEHAQLVEVPNAGHVPEFEATGCAMSITLISSAANSSAVPAASRASRPYRWVDGDSPSQRAAVPFCHPSPNSHPPSDQPREEGRAPSSEASWTRGRHRDPSTATRAGCQHRHRVCSPGWCPR